MSDESNATTDETRKGTTHDDRRLVMRVIGASGHDRGGGGARGLT